MRRAEHHHDDCMEERDHDGCAARAVGARVREKPDIQALLAEHIRATQERDRWVHKGTELFEAGDLKGAREALNEADEWAARLEALEDGQRRRSPHDV